MRPPDLDDSRRYELLQELGQGAFGSVMLAKDTLTGELVAIKSVERDFLSRRCVRDEILNHASLHHPHVIGFRRAFLSRGRRRVNIVMDYASGGTMVELVQERRRLREPLARWFFQQLVVAVDYCHKKGVVLRDIKLDNLLLQPAPGLPQPLLRICDFGYSRSDARGGKCYSKVGTLNYIAPEVLSNRAAGYDGRAADVWSCGVVLYALLTGRFPYGAPAPSAPRPEFAAGVLRMLREMHGRAYAEPDAGEVSKGCLALIERMLEPDPRRRITVPQILKDRWFSATLPSTALTMNERYLQLTPAREQSPPEVRAVVEAMARAAEASASASDSGSGDEGSEGSCATAWQPAVV
ncbi:sulfur stress regulator [Raphidocelis subcapitata]|uniref:Sulfur stress regulator n=1 Tax=Raphidocelis subcapitata TaxID=307507 RepID=A0A2V0PDE0_9CHLO|nr:sulfur stress regulator [Raphidocelis subcapitata]|eukprot:GBF95923.1 sulfur stress regulator [Raphidocelis subcapitata]